MHINIYCTRIKLFICAITYLILQPRLLVLQSFTTLLGARTSPDGIRPIDAGSLTPAEKGKKAVRGKPATTSERHQPPAAPTRAPGVARPAGAARVALAALRREAEHGAAARVVVAPRALGARPDRRRVEDLASVHVLVLALSCAVVVDLHWTFAAAHVELLEAESCCGVVVVAGAV